MVVRADVDSAADVAVAGGIRNELTVEVDVMFLEIVFIAYSGHRVCTSICVTRTTTVDTVVVGAVRGAPR